MTTTAAATAPARASRKRAAPAPAPDATVAPRQHKRAIPNMDAAVALGSETPAPERAATRRGLGAIPTFTQMSRADFVRAYGAAPFNKEFEDTLYVVDFEDGKTVFAYGTDTFENIPRRVVHVFSKYGVEASYAHGSPEEDIRCWEYGNPNVSGLTAEEKQRARRSGCRRDPVMELNGEFGEWLLLRTRKWEPKARTPRALKSGEPKHPRATKAAKAAAADAEPKRGAGRGRIKARVKVKAAGGVEAAAAQTQTEGAAA